MSKTKPTQSVILNSFQGLIFCLSPLPHQKDAPLLQNFISYWDIFTRIYSHAICVIAILYSISRRNINYTYSEFMTRGFFMPTSKTYIKQVGLLCNQFTEGI